VTFHNCHADKRAIRFLFWRNPLPRVALSLQARGAFTLVELMVSLSIIGLVASSSVFALLDSNRFATKDRLTSVAKAACQERIDQALTTPYTTPDALPPLFVLNGIIPAPNGSPDRGTQTTTESVSLYIDQLSTNQVVVQGTRVTRVSLSDAALGLVRVWVRVDYSFRSKPYSYEMYVVRAPD
jgi:prepilin-type N-terminal cleavage/methylation domain-containing protein